MDKSSLKMPKMVYWRKKIEAGGQTVLPDKSILVGLNSLENTINETFGVILKQCTRGANGVVMLL